MWLAGRERGRGTILLPRTTCRVTGCMDCEDEERVMEWNNVDGRETGGPSTYPELPVV